MAPVALTPREIQILAYIKQRWTNKAIATHLGIAIDTVKTHVHNMYGKMGLHTKRIVVPPRASSQHQKALAAPDQLTPDRREYPGAGRV